MIFGCGYVGTAFAQEAMARGARVTALTRNMEKARDLGERGIETIVADLASNSWHDRITAPVDFALNCVSSGGGGIEGYRHSYLAGMESVLTWARRRGPVGTLVYTSSTSVYPQDGGVWVDETAPTLLANERAAVLRETELRLAQAGRNACGRWFVLRLAGIYGPQRQHLVNQVRTGEVSGNGEHHLNLIHRDDIVSAIAACMVAPADVANEILNVVDDAPARKREVVEWLAARMGIPAPRFTGMPAEGRRALTPDRLISNANLKHRLGWQPRYPSFRDGYDAVLANR